MTICLVSLLLLVGCGQTLQPSTRRAGDMAAASATGGAALAMFVGLDDYNGGTEGRVRRKHEQLARVGSSERLAIFLAADADLASDGFRTRVTRGQAWGAGFEKLGELRTNHTPALRDFVRWVGRQAATSATHVVIGTHGGGHGGILLDCEGKGKNCEAVTSMSLQNATRALAKGYEGRRLESLTFDACMMGTIETGEALKGVAKVISASEDLTFGDTPWDEVAEAMTTSRANDGVAVARAIDAATIQRGPHGDRGTRTRSAFALGPEFDRLVRATDKLAGALIKAMPREGEAIRRAVRATHKFAAMKEWEHRFGDFYQRDLADVCTQLRAHVRDPAVQAGARAVEAAVGKAVVDVQNRPDNAFAKGLAIFLPHDLAAAHRSWYLDRYDDCAFARHTRWDEFLRALNAP